MNTNEVNDKEQEYIKKSGKYYAYRLEQIAKERCLSVAVLCASLGMDYNYFLKFKRTRLNSRNISLLKYLDSVDKSVTGPEFAYLIEKELGSDFKKQVEEWEL